MIKYPFLTHCSELRLRLFKILIYFIVVYCLSWFLVSRIYSIFLYPLYRLQSFNNEIIYTDFTEVFFVHLKLTFFSTFCLTLPVFFYHCYSFLLPALFLNERKFACIMFFLGVALFYSGILFAFFVVVPIAFNFFLSYENSIFGISLIFRPKISEYINFILSFMFVFGLMFEFPVLVMILVVFSLVDIFTFVKYRRLSVVVIFVVAAIVTPPDIVSQVILALPLIVLYECSIFVCKMCIKYGIFNVRSVKDVRYKMD